jgi:hypothetical protein
MNVLVVTSEPISADQLREALSDSDRDESEGVEVMVVAPALHDSALRFWLSDADEAIAKAQAVSRETVDRLGEEGIPAHGDSGESDPLEAIEDALKTFRADRIVVFKRPESEQRYREDIDVSELEGRFGLPVEQAQLPSAAH